MINVTNSKYTYDNGLELYMTNVFKYMSISLFISAIVAYVFSSMSFIYTSPFSLIIMFAPLIFSIYFGSKIWSMSAEKAKNCLFIYSALMGLSLSSIFLVYSIGSIVRVFLITSIMFLSMAIYGNTTKKDLTSMAQFLMMGLIGIFIASLVNIFVRSSGMEFMLSIVGVIVFTGLTAFDVQRLKYGYNMLGGNSEIADKIAVIGALNLYVDFVNLFLYLLRFVQINEKRK